MSLPQALKQLQMLLVEETSTRLLQLYAYERERVRCGLDARRGGRTAGVGGVSTR